MKAKGMTSRDRLLDSEKKYRQLVEDVNSIILRIDTAGRIIFLNKFARRFFGYKNSEILGKNIVSTIVPAADSAGADLKAMINDLMANPKRYVNNENENILRDGRRVWISWTNRAVFDKDKRAKEILCVGNDISRVKKVEEMLKDMDARKSAFVANVSHEFKNPLATIKGSLALILDGLGGDVSANQREMLEIAKKNIDRLIRLVTDLLDLSKIEAGKMKLKKEKIILGPLVDEVVSGNSKEISDKRLTFKKYIPDDIGLLWADKDKFTQVVINLVGNAIKYTPDGGKVTIKLARAGRNIRFEISNTGPGIARDDIGKLFDKFERITAEKQEGTGLGLSISKDIIELHKGKIWAESEPGKGAKFIFIMPKGS